MFTSLVAVSQMILWHIHKSCASGRAAINVRYKDDSTVFWTSDEISQKGKQKVRQTGH